MTPAARATAPGPRGVGEKRPPRGGAGRALPARSAGLGQGDAFHIERAWMGAPKS